MDELVFLSTEQYLVLLLVRLGIVPDEATGRRLCATEGFDGDAVRRLTQVLLLAEGALTEHGERNGDRTPADALDRAAADWVARLGMGPDGPPVPGPGDDPGGRRVS